MRPESSENLISLPVVTSPRRGKPAKSRMSKVRFTVLIIIQLLIIAHVVQWLIMGTTITPIEPSESMETVKSGVITVGFIFFVTALASTAILGRWFCGWGCHVVLLQDASGKLLERFGIRPKPFRSRALMLLPLALALYMFIWPLVYRFVVAPLMGQNLTWPGFSTHLTTTDFWGTFPGWIIGVPFLFVCGFLAVYLLGMKGYCTYGCPYGGFFAPMDKLSPGRIRVNDDCEQCGHCTAACTSNVKVHQEVRDFGMVIDQGCMKCLDCVSVCPKDALSFGFGKPSPGAEAIAAAPRRKWDLTWGEEIGFGALVVVVFLSVYQLYGIIPLLFASGITATVVYLIYKGWSCLKQSDVRFHGLQLKRAGSIRPWGLVYLGMTALVLVFVGHSAGVRGLLAYADYHDSRVVASPEVIFSENGLMPDTPIIEHARASRRAFEMASFIGDGGIALFPTLQPEIDNRIAWMLAVEHRRKDAERHMVTSIERYGASPQKSAGLARVLRSQGKLDEARAAYLEGIDLFPREYDLLDEYVIWLEQEGDPWEAITELRTRLGVGSPVVTEWLDSEEQVEELDAEALAVLEENPNLLGMVRRLSVQLIDNAESEYDLQDGIRMVEKTILAVPDNPFAYRALSMGYLKQQRLDEAIDALITAIQLEPTMPQLREQLYDLLSRAGRSGEARAVTRGEFP